VLPTITTTDADSPNALCVRERPSVRHSSPLSALPRARPPLGGPLHVAGRLFGMYRVVAPSGRTVRLDCVARASATQVARCRCRCYKRCCALSIAEKISRFIYAIDFIDSIIFLGRSGLELNRSDYAVFRVFKRECKCCQSFFC